MLAVIRDIAPALKSAEGRVAETVLNVPEIVVESTITELAEMARVSEPTVVRFCKKVGLSGYMELRINLAKDLPPEKYRHRMVEEGDTSAQVLDKVFTAGQDAMRSSLSNIDTVMFQNAVEILANAERIDLYGLGGAGIVALDAHHKFFRLGIPCNTYRNAHMQFMSASLLDKKSVVVAISNNGSSKDINESVRIAKSFDATVIGIIGKKKSPLHRICDLTFSLPTQESAWFATMSTRLVQIAILDSLFAAVVIRKYDDVKENLENVKRTLINKNL
ncbi:MAG: MurR/RpiR family transcriptional regulator [SAR324 cluster bacterium]|nr:MurR/RpiR family transcriptional regulator [SAR324 cluster bacterium]